MNEQERLAEELIEAIKTMANNEESLNNFKSYLSTHFKTWIKKWANTPEGLTAEFKNFSKIGG